MKLTKRQISKLNTRLRKDLVRWVTKDWLTIYCYTVECVSLGVWDEITMMCRGLILDKDYNIIARPFKKFFNYEEIPLPKRTTRPPLLVVEKYDWSLWVIYYHNGKRNITTKWSFNSEQNKVAQEMMYKYDTIKLDKSKTYMVEIIYPDNRIVIKYDYYWLMYLWEIEIDTWDEMFDKDHDVFEKPITYKPESYRKMKRKDIENREWYVLRYKDYKLKVKFETYISLHRVYSSLNSNNIRRALKDGIIDDVISMLSNDPKALEFMERERNCIMSGYTAIKNTVQSTYKEAIKLPDRKSQAEYILKESEYPWIVFWMLDGKDLDSYYRKSCMPSNNKQFRREF